jgi:O-methyltransferase
MISRLINEMLSPLGLQIRRTSRLSNKGYEFPVEASQTDKDIMEYVLSKSLTLVSADRLWATINSIKYVINAGIEGDVVECGVMRGGCSLAMAMTIKELGSSKKVYLYNTFAGITKPTELDVEAHSQMPALNKFLKNARANHNDWAYASIEDVKANFAEADCLHMANFVKGDVLATLDDPGNLPSHISLLRLDTDWFESTKKELDVLYPLLSANGVLLIDDYGHWQG